jgi:tryptophan-rich sensory protein
MGCDISAFLITLGLCLTSCIISGKSVNKQGREWYENLNQPKIPFTPKMMYIVGFIFYPMFGYILYHLFVSNYIIPIILVVFHMTLNTFETFLLYRIKKLKLFFVVCIINPIILIVLVFLLIQTKFILAILIMLYLLWLIYEYYYFYFLWKVNM